MPSRASPVRGAAVMSAPAKGKTLARHADSRNDADQRSIRSVVLAHAVVGQSTPNESPAARPETIRPFSNGIRAITRPTASPTTVSMARPLAQHAGEEMSDQPDRVGEGERSLPTPLKPRRWRHPHPARLTLATLYPPVRETAPNGNATPLAYKDSRRFVTTADRRTRTVRVRFFVFFFSHDRSKLPQHQRSHVVETVPRGRTIHGGRTDMSLPRPTTRVTVR